ncbi:MAG: gliding motility lipoprotein GldH [Ferruginibacter sp.]
MKFPFRSSLIEIAIILSFTCCRQIDLYEKNINIPDNKWSAGYAANGTFNLTDTLSSYNIYIVLRHTDAYNYNNIWLRVGLQSPGDSLYFQNIDLPLGSDASGWEGTGMNDIWEVRKLISGQPRRFRKAGIYNFSISQIMRDNPLPAVMSAGLRLEKIR